MRRAETCKAKATAHLLGIRVSCSLLVKGASSPNLDPSLRYATPSRTAVLTLPEAPSGPKDTHTHTTRACPKPDPHAHHNTVDTMLAIALVALWTMAPEARREGCGKEPCTEASTPLFCCLALWNLVLASLSYAQRRQGGGGSSPACSCLLRGLRECGVWLFSKQQILAALASFFSSSRP